MSRFYECHGHIMMDGADYKAAFEALAARGVSYFRDGGDADGITAEAKQYAADHPELGIEYVTPVFAIHRKGRYGGIVGRPFETVKEFRVLVAEAAEKGADFIKIMYSGIVTFRKFGELSTPPLEAAEIKELVKIAHGEGFAVMSHCNGSRTIMGAIEAGTDSIEHGVFMDDECIAALAETQTLWVPTIAAIVAFDGRAGFDPVVSHQVAQAHMGAVAKAARYRAEQPDGSAKTVLIAAGSDSGAFGVPHGSGTLTEYGLLHECGVPAERIIAANELLRGRFRR